MSETKTIEFGKRKELSPEAEAGYKNKIAEARESLSRVKGEATPVGHVARPTNIPILARKNSEATLEEDSSGVKPRPPGSPVLSPNTVSQIQAVAKATEDAKNKEKEVEEPEPKETDPDDDAVMAVVAELRSGDIRNEAELVLGNKKRRKEIESRCVEMTVEDLVLRGEVRQSVPIIPSKFVPVFRSMLPEESLFIKKRIATDKTFSDQHTLELYGYYTLCCSIVAINDEVFPSHFGEKGVDEDLFKKKLDRLMKMSGYTITDLIINLRWFDIRVRKLLNPEFLGNG